MTANTEASAPRTSLDLIDHAKTGIKECSDLLVEVLGVVNEMEKKGFNTVLETIELIGTSAQIAQTCALTAIAEELRLARRQGVRGAMKVGTEPL